MTRRRQRPQIEGGFSLVELLIALALAGIVIAVAGTVVVGSLRTSRHVMSRATVTADARIAMEAMVRRLRVAISPPNAQAFTIATSRRVQFYASLAVAGTHDPAPTLVDFAIDSTADCLRQTLTSGSSVRTTCVARGYINTDGAALFTYYTDGEVTSPIAVDSTGTVPEASLAGIRSVQIQLSVREASTDSRAPTVRALNHVRLVNLFNLKDSSGGT